MKLDFFKRRDGAMTAGEVLMAAACFLVLAGLSLSAYAPPKRLSSEDYCVMNLKQINLALETWAKDNNNQYPMVVSAVDGGGKEMIKTGNVAGCFRVVSNELKTTKLLVCPADPGHAMATNWKDLNNSNISYFLSTGVTNDTDPEVMLDGDDNFELNGYPVKPGSFDLSSNSLVEWAPGRHWENYRPHFWSFPERIYFGNLGCFANGWGDGWVDNPMSWRLQKHLQYIACSTNRIVIP